MEPDPATDIECEIAVMDAMNAPEDPHPMHEAMLDIDCQIQRCDRDDRRAQRGNSQDMQNTNRMVLRPNCGVYCEPRHQKMQARGVERGETKIDGPPRVALGRRSMPRPTPLEEGKAQKQQQKYG